MRAAADNEVITGSGSGNGNGGGDGGSSGDGAAAVAATNTARVLFIIIMSGRQAKEKKSNAFYDAKTHMHI